MISWMHLTRWFMTTWAPLPAPCPGHGGLGIQSTDVWQSQKLGWLTFLENLGVFLEYLGVKATIHNKTLPCHMDFLQGTELKDSQGRCQENGSCGRNSAIFFRMLRHHRSL